MDVTVSIVERVPEATENVTLVGRYKKEAGEVDA